MTSTLNQLNLGCADGDSESSKKNFLDLFYTGNNKYDEIISDPMKYIISGKKGTGKTVLGRYIEKKYNQSDIECKIFNKDDISLLKMIEKNKEELSGDEAIHLFKWILYRKIHKVLKDIKIKRKIGISRSIRKKNRDIRNYNKAISKLNKICSIRYGQGNYEFNEYTDKEKEISTAYIEGKGKRLLSKITGQTSQEVSKTCTTKEFYKLISDFEEHILTCLKLKNVVIILDDLDELDIDLGGDRYSVMALNKLIEAMKNINLLFTNNQLSPSKCILLIRSDIIEELNKRSSNLNKVIQDNLIDLYWIEKENSTPEKHMIMEMILNKVKKSSTEYCNYDNRTLYKILFPEPINKQNVVTYLINNSYGRPRDIITYLEIIKKRYPYETCFRAKMFRECKQSYSDAFLKELYNEAKVHIDLDVFEEYLNLIRGYGQNSFFASDIRRYHKDRRKNYKKISDVNECLTKLYKLGVIGNMRKSNNDKYLYSWGYRKDGNPNVNLEIKLTVHYGLRNILNTK